MNESEVTQMLRDAIDQDPKGRVWHVNTKHLVAFAQMVADKTRRELLSSPEEFSSWVKFYEDRIAHLDEMLVKSMDMNRELMGKLSGDKNLIRTQEEFEAKIYKNYNKEDQEKWDEYIYEQGEVKSKEDQKRMVQPPCKTHPDAPHGFSRNASHNEGRYVCECEHWKGSE